MGFLKKTVFVIFIQVPATNTLTKVIGRIEKIPELKTMHIKGMIPAFKKKVDIWAKYDEDPDISIIESKRLIFGLRVVIYFAKVIAFSRTNAGLVEVAQEEWENALNSPDQSHVIYYILPLGTSSTLEIEKIVKMIKKEFFQQKNLELAIANIVASIHEGTANYLHRVREVLPVQLRTINELQASIEDMLNMLGLEKVPLPVAIKQLQAKLQTIRDILSNITSAETMSANMNMPPPPSSSVASQSRRERYREGNRGGNSEENREANEANSTDIQRGEQQYNMLTEEQQKVVDDLITTQQHGRLAIDLEKGGVPFNDIVSLINFVRRKWAMAPLSPEEIKSAMDSIRQGGEMNEGV